MIGLDIGTYSIKAVELKKTDASAALVNFKIQQRSPQEALSPALKNFLKEGNFTSNKLNISVSGHLVAVRLAEMPWMNEEELNSAIRFEAEKNIAFNIEDAILDYQVISRDAQTKKIRLLYAAVKNTLVKSYIEAVQEAGFSINGVDVDGIALANAFLAFKKAEDQEKPFAILNVGDTFTNMSIVYQGIPCVVRDINISGRDVAEEIAKGLGVSKEEAYKIKHVFPVDKKEELSEMIRSVLAKLAREVSLSIGYFESQFANGVEGIYLSGGSSGLYGLKEFLSESLDMQIDLWNPVSSINPGADVSAESLEVSREQLAVAVGLALRDD